MRKTFIMPEQIMSGENVWDGIGSELTVYGKKV